MRWVKSKALLQVFILICAIFTISSLAPEVSAANEVCCEKTRAGEYCQMDSANNCDSRYNSASVTSCNQASFCKPVCCINNDEGTCYANTPFSTCFNQPNSDYNAEVPSCNPSVVSECRLGCCNIAGSYSLKTESQCNVEAEKNPAYFQGQKIFFPEITDEATCLKQGTGQDQGCCIANDGTCSYANKKQCTTSSNLVSNPGDPGFYKGTYCASSSLSQTCGCTSHARKGCVEDSDDVYWFDSCGNKEELAEDCDLDSKATYCGLLDDGSDYACRSANCENPNYYTTSPNTDVPLRKHSESWCVYESGVGEFRDRPGTRHYKATCSNGVEQIEECRDFREEICVEANVTSADLGTFSEAQCLYNDIYDSPIDERISTVPLGTKFWQTTGRTSTKRVGSDVCRQGNIECPVWYVKDSRTDDWDCRGNCQCETQEFIDQAANYCKSLGDCGADLNILGKRSSDGLSITWTGRARGPRPDSVSEAQWQEWEKYGTFGGIKELGKATTNLGDYLSGLDRAQQISTEYAAYTAIGGVVAGAAIYYGAGYIATYIATSYAVAAISAAATAATATGVAIGPAVAAAASAASAATTAASVAAWVPVIGWIVAIVALIVAGIMFAVSSGGNARAKIVTVTCNPWVPPSGGSDCSKCDSDPLGCTEYKCKSLGQACGLINIGTEQQKCVDQHPNDVNSPLITAWEETLTQGYSISKLPNGYEITPKVKPFTKITFGLKTNEPAQCKLDTKHTDSINEMPHFFNNDPNLITEHNLSLSLAGGQDYTYYIRCKDAKGNANQGEYAIKLSTEQTPDLSPPVIEATSIEKGASIRSDVNNQTFSVYLNEPAECKWSLNDKAYDAMENSFVCNTETYEDQTFLNTYECLTILEPINQAKDNNYFIKCKDNSGNINAQTFKFNLRRSSPLTVSVTTDPTAVATKLTSNEFELKATTAGGSDEGKATCRFNYLGTTNYDQMIDFFTTGGTQHAQSLQLQEGRYELNVVCRDDALNEGKGRVQFTLEKDTQPPKLTQVYKQAGSVYINIDEEALCQHSDKTFTYGQGTSLSTTYLKSFQIQEIKEEYWLACQDKFNNIMGPIHIVP